VPDENAELFWHSRRRQFRRGHRVDFGSSDAAPGGGRRKLMPAVMARKWRALFQYEAAAPDELYLSGAIASNNDFSAAAVLFSPSATAARRGGRSRDARPARALLDTVTDGLRGAAASGDLDESAPSAATPRRVS
jgi:hypothetical protein